MAYVTALASSASNEDTGGGGPGFTTLDGVVLFNLDRILLTRQTTASENGVWVYNGSDTQLSRPTATGDQYAAGAHFDNATVIWVTGGTARAGTVWGIDPAKVVTVDTTAHTLTRVSLAPVQARFATTENIDLATTVLVIDPTIVSDAMMEDTAAPTTLTCPSSKPFTSADVGKPIVVVGAGVAAADLATTIAGYTSSSVVTLANACATPVTLRVTDGAMNTGAGAKTLTCATSQPFDAGRDVGALIVVAGAGPGGATPDLVTTIAEFTSTSVVTLKNPCHASVVDAVVQVGTTTARYSQPLRGDGLAGSDIVLVKDQTDPSQNGLYWANTTGVMARCSEPLIPGRAVIVSDGRWNAHTRHELTTQGAIVPGTTSLNFSPQNPHFNVMDYGAVGDDATDNSAAFAACLAAIPTPSGSGKGAVVYVPPGIYRMSTTLDVARGVVMRGAGSSRYGDIHNNSVLSFPDGVTGIRTWHGGQGYPGGQRADGCVLEDLSVRARGHSGAEAYGLHMQTPMQVTRCTFTGFSSHGIFIDSEYGELKNGSPDNWQIQWTRCAENGGDGLHVAGGENTSNGLALGLDAQWNKGYGIYEASFLGSTYVTCHTAENLKGGYCAEPASGAATFLGCYTEGDQPPTSLEGANVLWLGGTSEAGITPNSAYYGYGLSRDAAAATKFSSTGGPALIAEGDDPPTVRLKGSSTDPSIALRIEITTEGYPDGKDAWGVPVAGDPKAWYRWTTNASGAPVVWSDPVQMGPAHDPYSEPGLSQFALGDTGLWAVFTPGHYLTTHAWTATGSGGLPTFFNAGSNNGTHAVFSWGHIEATGHPERDPGYQLNWNSSTRQWDLFWGGTPGSGAMHFAGGLPRAGHVTFDDGLWFGVEGGFNRITSACADNSVGSEQWLIDAGVNRGLVGCFTAGDHIVNRSNAVPFPRAWRAVESGGWSANVINEAEWQAETPYSAGDSVKPTNPATTTLFRAKNTGTSGADEPAWTTTRDSLVYEAGITWECVGPYGESIIEPVGIQSEVLGTYEVDADAVLTLRECSYERLKLTGAPVAARELEMPSVDGASGWRRVIWNTTGQLMTIKGSMGDAGITVPDGSAYDVMSDGTDCVRVE